MYGRVVIVMFVVLLAFVPAEAQPTQPKKRALVVGVSTYAKIGMADKPLPFAATDMMFLARELEDAGWDVTSKISRGTIDQANRAGIMDAIDRLLTGVNADDLVLIALSGHGQQFSARIETDDGPRELEEAFFCLSDVEVGNAQTMIGMTELTRKLGRKSGCNLTDRRIACADRAFSININSDAANSGASWAGENHNRT